MSHRIYLVFALIVFLAPSLVNGQVDFEKEIKPIFENHCISCHGPNEADGFRIDDKEDAMSFIEPEDADFSTLYTVLIDEDESALMPPPDVGRPLTEAQIMLVKTWINEGANWPDELNSEWIDVPPPEADDSQIPYRAAGSLHPAVVHLPIGLLLASGFFAFLSLRGNFVMSDCAYYCLWLGAIGAVFACATGWFFSEMKGYGAVNEIADVLNRDDKMYWHRITGLAAAVLSVILALFAASARNKDPDDGIVWKLGVMLLALGIGFVGHKGGELTYGEDHYDDVYKLYQSFFPENEREEGDRTIDESAEEASASESDELNISEV